MTARSMATSCVTDYLLCAELNQRLRDAIEDSDVEQCEELLSTGADVNCPDKVRTETVSGA
jgi:hypothetical protein